MRTCLAMGALLWLTLPASAESRAGIYTPQQLHDRSTVVFEGTVTRVETVAKYRKAFPVRAKVAAVLKGKLAGKDVSFRYKHPSRSVIREAEFNKPAAGQKGTFYLKGEAGALVLIGYIVKPAAATQRTSPRTQPATRAAPNVEATVSGAAKYARGNPLTIIVTLRNPQQKPLALWRPISVKASDLERFFRRHASCSLVRLQAGARDGKRPAGNVPGGRRTMVPNRFGHKWSFEWGKKQVVSGGKSVRFTFDLRQVFRLPADERGSYHFRITSVNPRFAASADFRIVDDPNVLQEKFVTWPSRSDREPEYTRRFCTVKTAAPGGPAYAVVLQEGGWANRTILRTAARPVALWAARLHKNPVMTTGVQLLWLDEKAQLWLLPPYLLWKVDVPLQRCFKTTVKSAVDIKSVHLVANPPDWKPGKSIQTVAFDVGVALDDGSVTHRYLLYKRYTFSKIEQAQYAKWKRKANN